MTKITIVTDDGGDILGILSTFIKGVEYKVKQEKVRNHEIIHPIHIQEYEVDEVEKHKFREYWYCSINLANGTIADIDKCSEVTGYMEDYEIIDTVGKPYLSIKSYMSQSHAHEILIKEREKWLKSQEKKNAESKLDTVGKNI